MLGRISAALGFALALVLSSNAFAGDAPTALNSSTATATAISNSTPATYPSLHVKDTSGEEALKLSGISRKELLKISTDALKKTGARVSELGVSECGDTPVFWTEIRAFKRDDGIYLGEIRAWISEVGNLKRRPETATLVTTFEKSYPAASKSPRDFKAQMRKGLDMILFDVQTFPKVEGIAQKPVEPGLPRSSVR
jgi:hypothetical protein